MDGDIGSVRAEVTGVTEIRLGGTPSHSRISRGWLNSAMRQAGSAE